MPQPKSAMLCHALTKKCNALQCIDPWLQCFAMPPPNCAKLCHALTRKCNALPCIDPEVQRFAMH